MQDYDNSYFSELNKLKNNVENQLYKTNNNVLNLSSRVNTMSNSLNILSSTVNSLSSNISSVSSRIDNMEYKALEESLFGNIKVMGNEYNQDIEKATKTYKKQIGSEIIDYSRVKKSNINNFD